jgi:DNA-binding helix-hairpin-helix protein with protein kinase domain
VTPQQPLYDDSGQPRRIDRRIAEGGEGFIYTLANDRSLLAKLYKCSPSPPTEEKLGWMVRHSRPRLREFTAWPVALLRAQPGGRIVGFLMPSFLDFQPIHHLCSAPKRLKYFPRADWSFLTYAARNCAAAFDEVHTQDANCLVGDVNQSNVLVSNRGRIGLIDCDSFQVQADGKLFLCEVGVGHYTPPELQGIDDPFKRPRTANHDRFGLAVLLFQLLFMGRYPYAGRYLDSDDMPFDRAIRECRFAYGSKAADLRMEQPPGTPPLSVVGPELAGLFERAFLRGSEASGARPSALEWVKALDRFRQRLRPCPDDPGHKTLDPCCVWCALVKRGGPDYFNGVAAVATVFVLARDMLAALWSRIEALARVDGSYERARLVPQPPPTPVPLPVGLAARPSLPVLVATPRPVAEVLPPQPVPLPLSYRLPHDPPDPPPDVQPVLAPPSGHLAEGRFLSHFLAAVNLVFLLLLVLSLFQHKLACFAGLVLFIVFPVWLIQRREHRRACARDEQRRRQEYESRMQAWDGREQRRQEQLRRLRQAREIAEQQRQREFEPRLRAWQQAAQQRQQTFQARLRAWEEAEQQRQRQVQAQEQVLREFEWRVRPERDSREKALKAAAVKLCHLEQQRQACADGYASLYRERRPRLTQAWQQCQRLETDYQEERRGLEHNREALAREQYLRTTFLIDHDIPNIGQGRLQVLALAGGRLGPAPGAAQQPLHSARAGGARCAVGAGMSFPLPWLCGAGDAPVHGG